MTSATSQDIRRILYAGDGPAALTAARSLGLTGHLQQVGDLALLALDHDAAAAAQLAHGCSDALGLRGWAGDQELAEAIDAARGIAQPESAPLVELAVDLDQLADLIDGGLDRAGGRLDLTTGEVWPETIFQDDLDEDEEEEDVPDRWLHVWPSGSRPAYNDMAAFTTTRRDPTLAARLERALDGSGAFRRFKSTLDDEPEDREAWFLFSQDRRRGRAREWLCDAGYRPSLRQSNTQ